MYTPFSRQLSKNIYFAVYNYSACNYFVSHFRQNNEGGTLPSTDSSIRTVNFSKYMLPIWTITIFLKRWSHENLFKDCEDNCVLLGRGLENGMKRKSFTKTKILFLESSMQYTVMNNGKWCKYYNKKIWKGPWEFELVKWIAV